MSIFLAESVGGSNQHCQKVILVPKDIPNRWYDHPTHIHEKIRKKSKRVVCPFLHVNLAFCLIYILTFMFGLLLKMCYDIFIAGESHVDWSRNAHAVVLFTEPYWRKWKRNPTVTENMITNTQFWFWIYNNLLNFAENFGNCLEICSGRQRSNSFLVCKKILQILDFWLFPFIFALHIAQIPEIYQNVSFGHRPCEND